MPMNWRNGWPFCDSRGSPESGRVTSYLDLSGLWRSESRPEDAVLNGIAHDPATGRLWVSGKLWPLLFEIRVH